MSLQIGRNGQNHYGIIESRNEEAINSQRQFHFVAVFELERDGQMFLRLPFQIKASCKVLM